MTHHSSPPPTLYAGNGPTAPVRENREGPKHTPTGPAQRAFAFHRRLFLALLHVSCLCGLSARAPTCHAANEEADTASRRDLPTQTRTSATTPASFADSDIGDNIYRGAPDFPKELFDEYRDLDDYECISQALPKMEVLLEREYEDMERAFAGEEKRKRGQAGVANEREEKRAEYTERGKQLARNHLRALLCISCGTFGYLFGAFGLRM